MKPVHYVAALIFLIVLSSVGCAHRSALAAPYIPAGTPAIVSKDCKLKSDGVTPAQPCKVRINATTIIVK